MINNDKSRLILTKAGDNLTYRLYDTNPVVDIATMENDLTKVAHVNAKNISLEAISISYERFRQMFYNSNGAFEPNLNILHSDPSNSRLWLYNSVQTKITENGAGREDFKLFDDVMLHYETDLSLPRNCWSACSLTNMERTIANQKTLFDVGGSCHIPCSMDLDEFFNALEDQGVNLAGTRYLTHNNLRIPVDLDKSPIAVVTALFKSTTSNVSDIAVSWPYLIDFSGVVGRYGPNYRTNN